MAVHHQQASFLLVFAAFPKVLSYFVEARSNEYTLLEVNKFAFEKDYLHLLLQLSSQNVPSPVRVLLFL